MVTRIASAEAAPGTSILHLTMALSLEATLRKVMVLFMAYSPSSTWETLLSIRYLSPSVRFTSSPPLEMYVQVMLGVFGPMATQLNAGCSVGLHSTMLVGPDEILVFSA